MENKTYKLTCCVCGKSYQSDKRRAKSITTRLKKDPHYLETYKCRSCKERPTPTPKTDIKVKSTSIPVVTDETMHGFIPKTAETYINRKLYGVKDEDVIKMHYQSDNPLFKNLLFIGETSTGKTALVRHFCTKYKIPYYRIVMNAGTTSEDMLGQMLMDNDGKFTFNYGVLVKFMQKGGIFVFDEINAGQKEILHILNSITDWERKAIVTANKGEVVEAGKNFLTIACMNPPDEYDLDEMSKSLKSRFVPYYFDYDNDIDSKILGKKNKKLLELAKAIRLARTNKQISTPLGTRDLLHYVIARDSMTKLVGKAKAHEFAKGILVNKFHNGEKAVVSTLIDTHLDKSSILDGE